jgi:hypothetical protein
MVVRGFIINQKDTLVADIGMSAQSVMAPAQWQSREKFGFTAYEHMSKYRIIMDKDNRFVPQRKRFGLFWDDMLSWVRIGDGLRQNWVKSHTITEAEDVILNYIKSQQLRNVKPVAVREYNEFGVKMPLDKK